MLLIDSRGCRLSNCCFLRDLYFCHAVYPSAEIEGGGGGGGGVEEEEGEKKGSGSGRGTERSAIEQG